MTGDHNEEQPPRRHQLTIDIVARAGRTRRGPLRRFALFCAGANPKLLRLVPFEEVWFSVIGTLVMVTTMTAFFGGFATAGYYFEGRVTVTGTTVAAGVGWATLIFLVERAIVRTPLNQVRFSAEVMEMLSGPEMDAVFQDIADGTRVYAVKRTAGSYFGVLAAISTRVGIAFLASFLVAESILMTIYGPEIEPLVVVRANQIATEVLQSNAAERQANIEDINAKIGTSKAALAPDLAAAQKVLPGQEQTLADLQNDVALIKQAYAAECNSRKVAVTLSTGLVLRTTGKPGCGDIAPGALLDRQAEYEGKVLAAQETVDATNLVIDTQQGLIDADPAIAALLAQQAKLSCKQGGHESSTSEGVPVENVAASGPVTRPANEPTKHRPKKAKKPGQTECAGVGSAEVTDALVRGIGIRETALRDLEQDTDPATVAIERAAPCTNAMCSIGRFVVYPSPAGRKVAAIRWILFLIEISAVLTKVAFVLRRRRPYDTLVGAMEVVQEGGSVAMAGNQLADLGLALEQKSAVRRKLRVGAIADVLLQHSARRERPEPHDKRKPRRVPRWWRLVGRTDDISEDEEFPPPPRA